MLSLFAQELKQEQVLTQSQSQSGSSSQHSSPQNTSPASSITPPVTPRAQQQAAPSEFDKVMDSNTEREANFGLLHFLIL